MEDVERRLTDYRRSCAENNALIWNGVAYLPLGARVQNPNNRLAGHGPVC